MRILLKSQKHFPQLILSLLPLLDQFFVAIDLFVKKRFKLRFFFFQCTPHP